MAAAQCKPASNSVFPFHPRPGFAVVSPRIQPWPQPRGKAGRAGVERPGRCLRAAGAFAEQRKPRLQLRCLDCWQGDERSKKHSPKYLGVGNCLLFPWMTDNCWGITIGCLETQCQERKCFIQCKEYPCYFKKMTTCCSVGQRNDNALLEHEEISIVSSSSKNKVEQKG